MKKAYMRISILAFISLFILIYSNSKQVYALTLIDSCGILDIQGESYFVTNNIIPTLPGLCLAIKANNITLDCNGFSVTGSGEWSGIYLESVVGVTVKNCIVEKFRIGINDGNGNMNTFERNTARYNVDTGFLITANGDNIIHNTALENGASGIGVIGSNNNINYNRADSNNENGIVLFGDGANYAFKNLSQKNKNSGILINNSDLNHLIKNRVNSNLEDGILVLANSSENVLSANNAEFNSKYGFEDYTVSNNKVDNHYIRNRCKNNIVGGSNLTNLCKPQP